MKLQDYIHYYIGCRCIAAPYGGQHNRLEEGFIAGVTLHVVDVKLNKWQSPTTLDFDKVKPILRKLEDITDEEFKDYLNWDRLNELYENVRYEKCEHAYILRYDIPVDIGAYPMNDTIDFIKLLPDQFNWLCKHGFDLFGLIENGLAIDSKTLNT